MVTTWSWTSNAAAGAFDQIAFIDLLPQQVSVSETAEGALVSWDTNGDGAADGSVLLRGVPMANLAPEGLHVQARPGFVAAISAAGSFFVVPAQ